MFAHDIDTEATQRLTWRVPYEVSAPDGLMFELGLRPGAVPLARYRSGDRGQPARLPAESGLSPRSPPLRRQSN